MRLPPDGAWGAPGVSGEWNGMIREVMDGVRGFKIYFFITPCITEIL